MAMSYTYKIGITIFKNHELKLSTNNFIDHQHKNWWKKPTGAPYSCTATKIRSVNNSTDKTLIEYDKDETLEIKEEIIYGMTIFSNKTS